MKFAAKQAFRACCSKAKPVLLEPIMTVEVVTPEEYMGDVIGDFNKRSGQVEGMESKAGARVIKAKVPLAEQFGYVTVLTYSYIRKGYIQQWNSLIMQEVPENHCKRDY
ncbi:MAG: hypothetical protein MZV63_39570 [Marinilabiliales bacterium]|nr:hypothetical protein [Marinilabiliales bacterium]